MQRRGGKRKKKAAYLEEEGLKQDFNKKKMKGKRGVPSHVITIWNITFYKYILLCTFPKATKYKV